MPTSRVTALLKLLTPFRPQYAQGQETHPEQTKTEEAGLCFQYHLPPTVVVCHTSSIYLPNGVNSM